jgi:SynChlorMet cassette radical SAM/SPASM protein ScmE
MIRYSKIPHSVRILLTNRCNLNCNFCLIDAQKNANKEELQTNDWLNFFERLKELRVFNVSISGGEIFLRNDLLVLLKKLRENRMHRITLLTNGTLITEEIANQLNELNIKNISISVDGLEETHDQIRGTGSFQKTIKGILNLINIGVKPMISFTPVRSNYKELRGLIDIISSMGLPSIQVNTLSPEGRCINIYEDIVLKFPNQVKEVLDVVEEKKKEYPDIEIKCHMGFHYHLPQSYQYYQKNPGNYEIKHLKDGCGAASTSCTITSTGNVIPCEGLSTFLGGNIREQDLADIWNNSENFKIIRDLAKVSMDQNPYCKDCKYIYLCDGGCRATAHLVYGDLLAPCITCPFCERAQLIKSSGNEGELNGNQTNAKKTGDNCTNNGTNTSYQKM